MLTSAMALLIGSIITGIASSTANIVSSINAKEAQESANQTNIDLAQEANEAQLQAVRETNEFNAAQAQIDRDRQDNQVQRMMADYSAAGLNPLLAANLGGSYATPTGATGNVAQIQRAHVNPASFDFSGLASAFSSMSNAMLISSMYGDRSQKNLDLKYSEAEARALNREWDRQSREKVARMHSYAYNRRTTAWHRN